MSATKPATGWTAETPQTNGIYWWRANERHDEPGIREVTDSLVYRIESRHVSPLKNYGGEWLGPVTPADFEQLAALREAAKDVLALKWLRDLCLNHRVGCAAITLYDDQCSCGLKDYLTTDAALRNALGLQREK